MQNLWSLGRVFNGIGKHTGTDVMHLSAFYPYMPTWVLCDNSDAFDLFIQVLCQYFDQWVHADYRRLVNSNNPFGFHYNSDEHYLARFMEVYRKMQAKVSQHLFNAMQQTGLLDFGHVIGKCDGVCGFQRDCALQKITGEPYSANDALCASEGFKFVQVLKLERGSNVTYTVIKALPPAEWGCEDVVRVSRPIARSTVLYPDTTAADCRDQRCPPRRLEDNARSRIFPRDHRQQGGSEERDQGEGRSTTCGACGIDCDQPTRLMTVTGTYREGRSPP